jgi:hypothetical protein
VKEKLTDIRGDLRLALCEMSTLARTLEKMSKHLKNACVKLSEMIDALS